MDEMLEELMEYGADIDGAIERFMGDVPLYKTCFTLFAEDDNFQKLGESIKEMNYVSAFDCAHTLKGITGNMGLTPLYQVICNIVEALRNNDYSHLQDYYTEIMLHLSKLKKLQDNYK